jgi:6-pyruvoyltetrahydropterin/6-carboxytetrahydropterin synthase
MPATYTLHVSTHFNSARSLRDYEGPCANIHGHTFKVQANVVAPEPDKKGLVIDFFDIKKKLEQIANRLNHHYVNELKPFDEINPTNENLAKYFFEELSKILTHPSAKVTQITVWESEESGVTYHVF